MCISVKGIYNSLNDCRFISVLVNALLGERIGNFIGVAVFDSIYNILACEDEIRIHKRTDIFVKRILVDHRYSLERCFDHV